MIGRSAASDGASLEPESDRVKTGEHHRRFQAGGDERGPERDDRALASRDQVAGRGASSSAMCLLGGLRPRAAGGAAGRRCSAAAGCDKLSTYAASRRTLVSPSRSRWAGM